MREDPIRLDLAEDAPAAAVDALRLARRDAPDAARLAAIEAAVLVKLAPPTGGGGGGDASGAPAGEGSAGGSVTGGGSAASSLSPVAKVGAAALAAGAAVVAVVLATRPPPPPVVAHAAPSVTVSVTAPSAAASPKGLEPPTLAVGDLPSAPAPSFAPKPLVEAAASAAVDPAESERLEVALLDRAQASLSGRPADALASCEEHARRFPKGTLVQEREVLAIDALLHLGRREEAEARAARFRQSFPRSGHLRRVDALLSR